MSIVFDSTVDIAVILALITTTIVIIFNYYQLKQMREQLKIQNEQMKLNFFADYTKRYQDIILHFPENINDSDFNLKNLKKKNKDIYDKTMRYMRVYFDLCSEEYFLHKKKHIDDRVWEQWKEGMKIAFNKPAFIQAWKIVIKDSIFYEEFERFVNKKLINKSDRSRNA